MNRAMRLSFFIFLIIISCLQSNSAFSRTGNPAEGKIIAFTCNGCHGIPFQTNVYPTYSVPRIGGQNYGYIVSSLQAYRDGNRKHPTMNAQAHTLSDEDMHHVAAYFVSLTEGTGDTLNGGENP